MCHPRCHYGYDIVLPKDRLVRHCHEEISEAVLGDLGAITSRLWRWSHIAIQGIIKAGVRLLLQAEFCRMEFLSSAFPGP